MVGWSLLAVLLAMAAAQSPPRGWNSYDSFNWIISEQDFLENCRIMAAKLPTYEYCVIDYMWFQNLSNSVINIDHYGRPIPALDRWPSTKGVGFKPIADAVHAMGLKFGIHIMRGISQSAIDANSPVEGTNFTARDIALTDEKCSWDTRFMSVDVSTPAGKMFYDSLYNQFADWEVDFIKNDCVFGNYVPEQIIAQSESIMSVYRNRDWSIVYSLSPGDTDGALSGTEEQWAKHIFPYVNMYRVTGDDWDHWEDLFAHFQVAANFAAANLIGEPGLLGQRSWPDLDMLPIGWITSPGSTKGPYRNTSLTPDEQRTQLSLWAIARSPLMFGGDLRHIDDFTLSLLTNPEVLQVNSNSSGNHEFFNSGDLRGWAAFDTATPDTALYVALFNTGPGPSPITVLLDTLYVENTCNIRNVWTRTDMGTVTKQISVVVNSHASVLYRLSNCHA